MLDLNMGTEAFVHRAVGRRGIGSGKVGTQMPEAMDLMGEIVALSLKHGMGIDVGEELKDILRRCDSEEDRRVVIQQYKALGLPYGGT